MENDDFFTRKYEDEFGADAVKEVAELLESEHETEAFFGLYAQLDLLVAEEEVDLNGAAFYNSNEWSADMIACAAQEQALLAKEQQKPCAVTAQILADAIEQIILRAKASAALGKAEEDGDDTLAATYAERIRLYDLYRADTRVTKAMILEGSAPAREEEAAQPPVEQSAPKEPEVVKLGSGLKIRFD